jgi:type I restriction enzyme R subunit
LILATSKRKAANDLGLSETEFAFYNILMSEVVELKGELLEDAIHTEIKVTTQALVAMFDEATQIVDFFNEADEVKRIKKEIKRAVLDTSFGDKSIIGVVQDRFIDLGKVHLKGQP